MKDKNITEDYVSFETAKLLKEKGFNPIYCGIYYSLTGKRTTELLTSLIACPTLQMTMKWLRDKHNLHITIDPYTTDKGARYTYRIYNLERCMVSLIKAKSEFENNESACEDSIKYCLMNFI